MNEDELARLAQTAMRSWRSGASWPEIVTNVVAAAPPAIDPEAVWAAIPALMAACYVEAMELSRDGHPNQTAIQTTHDRMDDIRRLLGLGAEEGGRPT